MIIWEFAQYQSDQEGYLIACVSYPVTIDQIAAILHRCPPVLSFHSDSGDAPVAETYISRRPELPTALEPFGESSPTQCEFANSVVSVFRNVFSSFSGVVAFNQSWSHTSSPVSLKSRRSGINTFQIDFCHFIRTPRCLRCPPLSDAV